MKFIVLFLILVSVLPSHGFLKFDQYNYCRYESCPGEGSYNLATWEELGVFAQKQREMSSLLNDTIATNKSKFQSLENQKKEIKEELDKSNATRIATMIDEIFNTDANVGVNANREKLTQMIRQIVIEELKKK